MYVRYMKEYGVDALVNDGTTTRVFFKEIKDSDSNDLKYLYGDNGIIKQGDSIVVEGKQWIVTHEDTVYSYSEFTRFIITIASNRINFVNDGNLFTTYGLIQAGSMGTSGGSVMPILNGNIVLTIPLNETSDKIRLSDRLIKFNQAWKILSTSNENSGLINIYCKTDQFIDGDDKENEIPDGMTVWTVEFSNPIKELSKDATETLNPIVKKDGVIVTEGFNLLYTSSDETVVRVYDNGLVDAVEIGISTITVSVENTNATATIDCVVTESEVIEYLITPSSRIVRQLSSGYNGEVYKYVNGVKASDEFTITAFGDGLVSGSDYTLTVNDGNSFKIVSGGWEANKLTVRCVSNTDGYILEEEFSLVYS